MTIKSNCGPDPESDPKLVELLEIEDLDVREQLKKLISEVDWRQFIKENEDGK